MGKILIVLLSVAFLAAACNIKPARETKNMAERVDFQTQDGVNIVADYYPAQDSSRGIILLHMMPATRESWNDFAAKLQGAGFHALAIDLRGHGESGGGSYQNFSDEQHQASIRDLEAAAKFLRDKGIAELFFAGASIGANLALQYLAEHPETKAAVLLSPGVDYRGIKIEPLATRVSDKQKILFVGAEDDAATMDGTCEEIAARLGGPQKICYQTGGHGTNLFRSHPELMEKMEKILDFLNSH